MSESWTNSLLKMGARFDAGRVTGYASDTSDYWSIGSRSICDLSHYGLMRVSGEDAGRFLQAQLTNDVLALEVGAAQLNGWCSPKGRLLAVFTLWRTSDAYYLMLPRPLQAGIQKRLGMFVLRSKVAIEDASALTVRWGLIGGTSTQLTDILPDSPSPAAGTALTTATGTVVRLSLARTIVLVNPQAAEQMWRDLLSQRSRLTANAWDLATIRDGVIEVLAETQDAYVPQMANFELAGGVSFKKGCYPGQEIVARTQYRGILKRRMVRVRIVSETTLSPGTPIYSPLFPEQAAGTLALSARADANSVEALVVAQLEAIRNNSLFVDQRFSSDGRLDVLALPYQLPDQL